MQLKRQISILGAAVLIAAMCFAQSSGEVRKSRISFLPPPVDGAISLGVYDESGQLVRVLHQEADVDEFTIGADALVTSWDGKDNDGFDLPAGSYHARGFVVPKISVRQSEESNGLGAEVASAKIKLVANPLMKNERATIEVAVGSDDENAFIKTADGLPLLTLTQGNDISKASLTSVLDNKTVSVLIADGKGGHRFEVTGLEKMMAFDCGEIELK